MKKSVVYLMTLALFPAQVFGQKLENDRFRINVEDSKTIVMSEQGKRTQTFKLDFVVLYNVIDPQLRMSEMSEIRYSIPSWTAVDPKKANIVRIVNGEDYFAVGDGFDPGILKGSNKGRTNDIFQAAPSFWISAKSHSVTDNGITFSFKKHPLFSLTAFLSLEADSAYPKLSFQFEPLKSGYYSVGYVGAPGSDLSACDEIWQPLVWQEKRFPEASHVTLAFRCPVPSAFVTERGVTTGVVADPGEYPFEPLPLSTNSRFGIAVRDVGGKARAMLFAPALGGLGSEMNAGSQYAFAMRLFTTVSDAMEAQEKVARELYGFRDYRNNALGSLNRTMDNFSDYIMSKYSLFDEKYKGCNYSTDAPGAVKNVSSIDPIDLSIIMDDKQMFERRAYPYMEYMLSRGKFLFTVDEKQKTQFPSYRLNGPVAPVSELSSLYSMFHKATPLFMTLAQKEFRSSRVRNLNVPDKGDTWWNALSIYRTTGDKDLLAKAIKGADDYIQKRLGKAQTNFKDPDAPGGAFFWTGFAPRYIDLLMLYEASGESRFLDAARTGARRYAQFVYMSPAIPDRDIIVNKGGKAPEYWYLKGKGHKQVHLPEESVPAWRVSAMGLTPESSGTSQGHRAIFMANHAPWMLKIGYLTKDQFLMDIARSAVIGRYRNFPGYHINTARTTAYEKKEFPLVGHMEQSVNSFHYNHPLPMLSMLVDYLVTDAYVRSNGQIDFPYNYSEGYAYMQNKAYGAMRGSFFGRNDALLWMPKGLLQVPDQINYLSARGENDLYVALMNESQEDMDAEIVFNRDLLAAVAGTDYAVEVISGKDISSATLSDGKMRVPVKARGLTALVIRKLRVIPVFQDKIADLDETAAWDLDMVDLKGVAGRAMILNLGSANRYAYVFLEYSKQDYIKVELIYNNGGVEKRVEKTAFPWEFTAPLSADADTFTFTLNGHKPDGTVTAITPLTTLKCNASVADTTTILALGNSITARRLSYRSILIPALTDKGLAFKFIGPEKDSVSHHAGYGGRNTKDLLNISKEVYTRYPADIVMIHSGHNNFSKDKPVQGIVRDTEAIIDNIREINPEVKILLAQVIPAGKLPKYSYIPELNRELESLAERLVNKGINITLVNQEDGFDWRTDTVEDKVHPNSSGAKKMSEKWMTALLPALGHTEVLAYEQLRLWEGPAPGVAADITPEKNLPRGRVSHVSIPTLDVYRPHKPNGIAMIICSGGAYEKLASGPLGLGAADEFLRDGYTVFSLKYRLSPPSTNVVKDACMDGARAVRLIRSRAKEWKIDPERIGMVGFSAGANMILNLACNNDKGDPNAEDPLERLSGRPNFMVLAALWGHEQKKIGDWAIHSELPPALILTARDDHVAPVKEVEAIARALRAAEVPVQLEIYDRGGHMAFNFPSPPAADWPQRFRKWIKQLNVESHN